jgi:hypothetical protein
MATGASLREVRFACFGIADEYIQLQPHGISAGRAALSSGGRQYAVYVLGHRHGIRLDQVDFGIVTGDGFADQFAVLIAESGS